MSRIILRQILIFIKFCTNVLIDNVFYYFEQMFIFILVLN